MSLKRTLTTLALVGSVCAPAQAVSLNFLASTDRWDQGTNWYACTYVFDCFPGAYGVPDFGDTVTFNAFSTAVIFKGKVGEATRVEIDGNATVHLSHELAPGDYNEPTWAKLTVKDVLFIGYTKSGGTLHNEFGLVDAKTVYVGYGSGTHGSYVAGTAPGYGSYFGTLQAAALQVGVYGSGSFIQYSNSKTHISGDLTLSQYATSEYGSFTLDGGEVRANNEIIGRGGYGRFTQRESDGESFNRVTDRLVLGNDVGAYGEYFLKAGQLFSASHQVGQAGVGYFEQTGGTNTTGSLYLGMNAASTGNAYALKSGTLSAIDETIGYQGSGSFTQTGGTNTATGTVTIGHSVGGGGSYMLQAGTLEAKDLRVGREGHGEFTLDGGTGRMSGALYVGTSTKDAYGDNIFSDAYLKSGTLSSGTQIIGHAGAGRMTQTGGSNTVATYLAVGSGSPTAVGVYELNGGSLSAPTQYIGNSGELGVFLQQAGTTNTVSNSLTLGRLSGSAGAYFLNGGTLTVGSAFIGSQGTGTFVQSGGAHTVAAGLTVADNGSYYKIANGALKATTITAQDDAAFLFNGGVLSVQTFIGELVNRGGTLSPAAASAGSTHVVGNYVQAANGSLAIELGGTAPGLFDAVNVDGTASLAGTLDVSFLSGSWGRAGDSFDILSATTLLGSFDTLQLAALDQGLDWLLSYRLDPVGIDTLNLSVVAVPEPGTYALFLAGLGMLGWVARRRIV